jgi:hypothetical protein
MGKDNFHKLHLTPARDVGTFYPRVIAFGFLKCDKRVLFELTEFVALQFKSACFSYENAVDMLWQSVGIDENHSDHSTLNVFMLYVRSLQKNPAFLTETIVFLMDPASPHVSEAVWRSMGQKKIMTIHFFVRSFNTL